MTSLNTSQILLIHPLGYRPEAAGRDVSRLANIMPPLGLAVMAAYLKKRDIDCAIVDCFARPSSDQAIRDYLNAKRPAFVGLSCTTSSFFDGLRVSRLAKSTLSNIQVVFGGPHVSALKESILENFPIIDFVVAGEGEETLAELMERDGKGVENVKGLVYRKSGGEISFTGYRTRGIDLDSLPFPAYEKLAGYPEVYKLPIFSYPKAPNSTCISSRGCP
jgi:radical SAM superfamily enzyme YgiQ (UPF0313 family)